MKQRSAINSEALRVIGSSRAAKATRRAIVEADSACTLPSQLVKIRVCAASQRIVYAAIVAIRTRHKDAQEGAVVVRDDVGAIESSRREETHLRTKAALGEGVIFHCGHQSSVRMMGSEVDVRRS